MKSSYSHSLTSQSNPNLSREEIYNPRVINKYQNLWLENNKNIRTKPMVTENVYWK